MTRPLAIACLLAVVFIAGVLALFGVEFAAGDVYPDYSSLRSDPAGSKLLYDSLARLPGVSISRNYLPLEGLNESGAAVLVLAGESSETFESIEPLARRGNRVLVTLVGHDEQTTVPREWGVRVAVDTERKHAHRLYFAEAPGWSVLDRIGGKLLAIERDFGKGSIVLFAESEDFANQSVAASDRLELIATALGPYRRIVFDEQHLGIGESGSVVGLVRRYRLTGMALGLAVLAALFLWRSASAFPPPPSGVRTTAAVGRTSHSGLLTLLRRHIAPRDLLAACWREWLATNRRSVPADRLEQAAALARSADRPLEAAREIQTLLFRKRTL
jgi:hypothetical protein